MGHGGSSPRRSKTASCIGTHELSPCFVKRCQKRVTCPDQKSLSETTPKSCGSGNHIHRQLMYLLGVYPIFGIYSVQFDFKSSASHNSHSRFLSIISRMFWVDSLFLMWQGGFGFWNITPYPTNVTWRGFLNPAVNHFLSLLTLPIMYTKTY